MLPVLRRKAHLSHSRFWEYGEVNINNYLCHFFSLLWTFILLANVGILFFCCMIGSLFSDKLVATLCWLKTLLIPGKEQSLHPAHFMGLSWLTLAEICPLHTVSVCWLVGALDAYGLAQNLKEWKLIGIGRCIVDPSRIVFQKHWLRIARNVFHESLARHLIYRICKV